MVILIWFGRSELQLAILATCQIYPGIRQTFKNGFTIYRELDRYMDVAN